MAFVVLVKIPATTANLGPGFNTLGMALNLFNYVEMWETGNSGDLSIEIEGEGISKLARDRNNIVWQAAREVFKISGYQPHGLGIRLKNEIPVARGLGSSAAAHVGGLVAANYLAGGPLNFYQLMELAIKLEGHPDNVAAALLGGLAVAKVSGKDITYRKIDIPTKIKVILAIPNYELSTRDAVGVLPGKIPVEDVVFNIAQSCLLVTGFLMQDWELVGRAMEDRLHQPYRQQLVPGLQEVLRAAKEAGALGAALSGAGPTVLALTLEDEFIDNGEKIGQAMQRSFRDHGVETIIKVLKPWGEGACLV